MQERGGKEARGGSEEAPSSLPSPFPSSLTRGTCTLLDRLHNLLEQTHLPRNHSPSSLFPKEHHLFRNAQESTHRLLGLLDCLHHLLEHALSGRRRQARDVALKGKAGGERGKELCG
jgi:hypothetical protein